MLCLKQFEAQATRDITVAMGLCLFVLLTAFLYNSSIVMWLYSLLVVYALLRSMKHIESGQSITLSALKPDRTLLRTMAFGLPLAALFFVLIPRPAGPLWGIPAQGGVARTGLTEQMSPGEIGQLSDNDSVAFRVTFKGAAPDIKNMYWRGPIFTFFNGHTWREQAFIENYAAFNLAEKVAFPGNRHYEERYHYQVLLKPHNHKWLFTLSHEDSAPAHTHYSSIGQLLAEHPVTSTYIYEIDPEQPRITRKEIAPYTRRYLRLPSGFGHRTRKLIKQFENNIDRNRTYDVQIAKMALDYFQSNNFIYTRKPPILTHDPIDQFLFNSRAGFCEHYASAFTFMMRAAGIPARIVTGYQGAEYNPAQDYYIVRQSNAHAWTEVWLQHQGWTRIDPTTVIPASRIDRTSITQQQPQDAKQLKHSRLLDHPMELIGYYLDAIDYQWGLHFVGFDTKSQNTLLQWFQDNSIKSMLLILIIAAIFALVSVKWKRSQPHDAVAHCYQQFCNKLARHGFHKAAYETATNFEQRVIQSNPHWQPRIQPITALYLQLRYTEYSDYSGILRLQQQVKAFRV